ncbi:helix-turn-helix domain-containing protein [Nonomuraea sp. NPDC050153]|uniref:helix-turn-helix domain-containing protein n=1 Tax=Nonomuraea sp. NPDC050153 TaxID=3364359 RepID=UPI003798EBD3
MPESRISPPYRLSVLGMRLAQLREARHLTGAQVAQRTGVTPSALSRLERGKNSYVTPGDVRLLLDLYDGDDDVREECLELVADARLTPYWAPYRRALGELEEYVALETEARHIRYWHPLLIPGLLQTDAYAREVIAAERFDDDPSLVRLKVRARLARQWIVRCDHDPVHVHALLAEGVLRQNVGGPAVMREQLDRLVQEAGRPNVTVRVIPQAVGAHPGLAGGFVLLNLPWLGDTLFIEAGGGGVVDRGPRVQEYGRLLSRLQAMALPDKESAALIAHVAEEIS